MNDENLRLLIKVLIAEGVDVVGDDAERLTDKVIKLIKEGEEEKEEFLGWTKR